MHRNLLPLILLLALPACQCNEDKDDTSDSQPDTDCVAELVETTPEDGESGWYYRDPLRLQFSDAASDLATIALLDEAGDEQDIGISWESSDFVAVVQPDASLAASSAYTIAVDVCEVESLATFSTSEYGSELAEQAASLEHNTYVIDFDEITFSEPENLELILSMLGVNPLLVGVAQADGETITLYVAEGKKKVTGGYRQLDDGNAWWFDPADFSEQPYFYADQDELSLAYEDTSIPIRDFHIEGTFAADGSSIGGVSVSGVADTRYIAEQMTGDPDYICDMVGDWGISCVACDDGLEYCVGILAEDVVTPLVVGLDIIPAE